MASQAQDSLRDQLRRAIDLCNKAGEYDAADFITVMLQKKRKASSTIPIEFWKVSSVLKNLDNPIIVPDTEEVDDIFLARLFSLPILAYDHYGNLGEAIFTERDGQIIVTTKDEVEQ